QGYSEKFSLGLITSCGAIGILVPPSLPLIIYGVMAGVQPGIKAEIRDLFVAGIVPGILCVGIMMVYAAWYGAGHKVPRPRFSWSEVARTFKEGFFALLMPVILLVGIYGGIATVSEVAAVAVVYALVVELFIHREITWKQLPKIVTDSGILIGS